METNPVHITVVDDDNAIRQLLSDFLCQHGYAVSTAANANQLFSMLEKNRIPELIVLDVMLPVIDGIEICRRLRQNYTMPIIMLTAAKEESDKIIGLELGADDYMVKPFNPRELLARIHAVLRRTQHEISLGAMTSNATVLEFLGWTLNTNNRQLLSPQTVEVPLSSGVYDLLLIFLKNPSRVLSRDQLMDMTKNRLAQAYDRSIDIQISRLRQKLEIDPKNPQLIKTIRSGGYMFTAAVQKLQR